MQTVSIFIMFILSLYLGACISTSRYKSSGAYDERDFSILTLNLFNQRFSPSSLKLNWKGDWLFRRERLELIDEHLRITKPDIIVFQELMARTGSPSESDINILSFGALDGYAWDVQTASVFEDTQESQFQAIAVGLPVKLLAYDRTHKDAQVIGEDGFFSYTLLELDHQPILVVNLRLPSDVQWIDRAYQIARLEIRQLLEHFQLCQERLIVSGDIPGGNIAVTDGYTELLAEFQLKDSSTGFCEANADCLTKSLQNELFLLTAQGQPPSHSDRILVPIHTIVSASQVAFNKMRGKTQYSQMYGLQDLWASRSFGWIAQVRLKQCPKI